MQNRNSYHTTLKELVYHNLLPEHYLKSIPRTNLHRWKNDFYDRYVGSDINDIAKEHADTIRTVSQFPKMLTAYAQLVKTLLLIASFSEEFNRTIRNNKDKVMNAIINAKELIPISKAVEVFNISKATFHSWVMDVKLKCKSSALGLCNKVYPSQITPNEVKMIKDALRNPKTLHWSIRSIYLNGINNGWFSVSENTIYKVNKFFNIRDTAKRKRKKRFKKGIRANWPNQIWHADITVFKTLDGVKHYIYLVIDNCSRFIIAYAIADKVCGQIRRNTIKQAYERVKSFSKDDELNIDLIVDGGPENNNVYINSFIDRSDININKLIALKQIEQSNSMVERVNNTLKYQYLFPREIRDKKHLNRTFLYFLKDYNTTRPHGQLKGLTPYQAWIGGQPDSKNRLMLLEEAKKKRIEYSRANKCSKCS